MFCSRLCCGFQTENVKFLMLLMVSVLNHLHPLQTKEKVNRFQPLPPALPRRAPWRLLAKTQY